METKRAHEDEKEECHKRVKTEDPKKVKTEDEELDAFYEKVEGRKPKNEEERFFLNNVVGQIGKELYTNRHMTMHGPIKWLPWFNEIQDSEFLPAAYGMILFFFKKMVLGDHYGSYELQLLLNEFTQRGMPCGWDTLKRKINELVDGPLMKQIEAFPKDAKERCLEKITILKNKILFHYMVAKPFADHQGVVYHSISHDGLAWIDFKNLEKTFTKEFIEKHMKF